MRLPRGPAQVTVEVYLHGYAEPRLLSALPFPFFLFVFWKEPRLFCSYCDAAVERPDGHESTRREPNTTEQKQENPHGDQQKTNTGSRHERRRSHLLPRLVVHVNLNTFFLNILK